MATASYSTTGKRDVIRFETDQAVTVALKYATGRVVSGTHGPQMMYTTSDDRVFFLDPQIAESLEGMNLRKGERVRIAKLKRPGTNRIEWDIERVASQQSAPDPNKNGSQNTGLFDENADARKPDPMADTAMEHTRHGSVRTCCWIFSPEADLIFETSLATGCSRISEAAHVGVRGLGSKCDDRETAPLCPRHHRTGLAAST